MRVAVFAEWYPSDAELPACAAELGDFGIAPLEALDHGAVLVGA